MFIPNIKVALQMCLPKPGQPDINGNCYSEEALKDLKDQLCTKEFPIVANGFLSKQYYDKELQFPVGTTDPSLTVVIPDKDKGDIVEVVGTIRSGGTRCDVTEFIFADATHPIVKSLELHHIGINPKNDDHLQVVHNDSDCHDVDGFKCSGCGVHLEGWTRVVVDEDDGDVLNYEYSFKFCPNCGKKISVRRVITHRETLSADDITPCNKSLAELILEGTNNED